MGNGVGVESRTNYCSGTQLQLFYCQYIFEHLKLHDIYMHHKDSQQSVTNHEKIAHANRFSFRQFN